MAQHALTIDDVACEFGFSRAWLYANWRKLVADGKIPKPLIEDGHLTWSRAQFYAFMDKDLPRYLQALAAAHRAAFDAALRPPQHQAMLDEQAHINRLNEKFGSAR